MTKEEYIKNSIIQQNVKIDGVKKIQLRHPASGVTIFLDINAAEDDINTAKDNIVASVLKFYDVVEVEGIEGEYTLEIKEEFK